jgi:nucleotide-binding universal stress UspA family protein
MVGGYVPPFAEFEQAVVADLKADCASAGLAGDLDLELYALRGQTTECLVAAASHAEMLVVGARGAGGFKGLRFGSTATQVVRHSPVPVLVVPNFSD